MSEITCSRCEPGALQPNDDAAIIAAYVTLLDRIERNARDPATRELARRVQGNVWKLARLAPS